MGSAVVVFVVVVSIVVVAVLVAARARFYSLYKEEERE